MSRGKFGNSRKTAHLAAIPEQGLDARDDNLTIRCKFNLSYFCTHDGIGKNFGDLTQAELEDLLTKMVDFGRQPLSYWKNQRHGVSSTLAIYKNFPVLSDFAHPKHVPNDVHWARFRLSKEVRLAGFIVPPEYEGKAHQTTNATFDCNTFYVVFIDYHHGFYKSKK